MGRLYALLISCIIFFVFPLLFVDAVQNVCYLEKSEISRKKYRHGKELPYGGKV